jgi:hypothetical protein
MQETDSVRGDNVTRPKSSDQSGHAAFLPRFVADIAATNVSIGQEVLDVDQHRFELRSDRANGKLTAEIIGIEVASKHGSQRVRQLFELGVLWLQKLL